MNSEERACEIASVFYHERSAEYRSLKNRIRVAIDAAVAEERKLVVAYWQEIEAWRSGDGVGDLISLLREDMEMDSDPYIASWVIEGAKEYTAAARPKTSPSLAWLP